MATELHDPNFHYRNAFADPASWRPGHFEEACADHGITPKEDEVFSQTAIRMWDVLTDDARTRFALCCDAWEITNGN
jgi:hypothetical protein